MSIQLQEASMNSSYLRRNWFPFTSGAICFLWALIGWLTVIPNQDILADGIQAQSVLADPRVVLAFPGQKHGGPLEYPATLIAEALAPGNYFANALVRPFLAFATGLIVALLFRRIFPKAPQWSFIAAIAVGPTVIHGLLGPAGNTVGVWWLQPNWDMAWLFGASGALVLAHYLAPLDQGQIRANRGWPLLGGFLFGLGFFAHPAIVLLLVPLLALVLLRSRLDVISYTLVIAGGIVGSAPAAISYVVNSGVNTWDPSHGAFISVSYYMSMGSSVLGLNGITDYMTVLLPYGMGLTPSTLFLAGTIQSAIMWIVIAVILLTSFAALIQSIRTRSALTPSGAIAMSWTVAIGTLFAFITFVDPVWIYSSGLSLLFWLSVGALPSFFVIKWVGNFVTIAIVAIVGISTVTHNAEFYSDIPDRITQKKKSMDSNFRTAAELESLGAKYVFGSYYDAIPIGYASGLDLRTLTNKYNRFPLTSDELNQPSILVAVNMQPTDLWGEESLDLVTEKCANSEESVESDFGSFTIFECAPSVLDIQL